MLVRYYLKHIPYSIDEAENGSVAVDKFMEQKYDLVIMGMHMPVMDGSSATKAIRAWEEENEVPRVPIIALTDHYIPNDGRNSILAGCSAHLAKPVEKAELLGLIEHFTGEETSEVREKKALEEENARLKKLVDKQAREIGVLKKSKAKK
ncbi:MAG: response regulator [Planctomycetota bacterium]|nr:response regulator [Planctomycetota bacterium]